MPSGSALARLKAKGNALVPSELDALVKDGSLHQVSFVNLFHRLSMKGHDSCVAYAPGQWLDVDDAINLLPADRFL